MGVPTFARFVIGLVYGVYENKSGDLMMKKIAFISDIHGNLPAFKAVLKDIKENNCTEIVNLGDSIAIGPSPSEVLELLKSNSIESVLGNHESYYIFGLENQLNMHEGEREHQKWVHSTLGNKYKKYIMEFPLYNLRQIEGNQVLYLHYPSVMTEGNQPKFSSIPKDQNVEAFRKLFVPYDFNIVVFGHHHVSCCIYDKEFDQYYINTGSVGCSTNQLASYVIVCFENEEIEINQRAVEYDTSILVNEMIERNPPEYENLLKWFYGIEI